MTRTGAAEQPGVLSIGPLRRLWVAVWLSSLGGWLGLLALIAMAWEMFADEGPPLQLYAIGLVLLLWALPGVLLAAPAAALAGRLDRRTAMAAADALCLVVLLLATDSATAFRPGVWTMPAAFVIGFAAVLWRMCAAAAIPDLVPPDRAADARRLVSRTVYGAAPVAAALFALLALAAGALLDDRADRPALLLGVSAGVLLLSAVVVFVLKAVPGRAGGAPQGPAAGGRGAGAAQALRWPAVALAAVFAAGGAAAGVAKIYAETLEGGDAGFGAVLATGFAGMAFGAFQGPRLLGDFSRRRLLGLSVVLTGLVLAAVALVHDLTVVAVLTAVLGWTAGVAWATVRTLVDTEVEQEARGPARAFLRSLARVVLLVVLPGAPLLAGLINRQPPSPLVEWSAYSFDGANAVLLGVALLTLLTGLVAYRKLDDRRGVPLVGELTAALRGVPYVPPGVERRPDRNRGVFIAFEGGEGAGKTTQARLTAIWLRDHGYDVVTTNEPGATKIGMRLRAILLDKETTGLSSRAETLLYAADRADHVANVIRPALARGAIVVTDRYVDSSLAYQGYGRELPSEEIAEVNGWATGGLLPDLTVLLDIPPEIGFGRFASPADRMESQPMEFHERVRRGFLKLAEADPDRYLVVDAGLPQEEITRRIRDRVREILPDPIPADTEDITSTFPAIAD